MVHNRAYFVPEKYAVRMARRSFVGGLIVGIAGTLAAPVLGLLRKATKGAVKKVKEEQNTDLVKAEE